MPAPPCWSRGHDPSSVAGSHIRIGQDWNYCGGVEIHFFHDPLRKKERRERLSAGGAATHRNTRPARSPSVHFIVLRQRRYLSSTDAVFGFPAFCLIGARVKLRISNLRLLLSSGLLFSAISLAGQGVAIPTVLRTGEGSSLVSKVVMLPPAISGDLLQLEIGFATDEKFGPGQIFDSFTVSVQGRQANDILLLLTLDASGALFAPQPSNVSLDPASISRALVPFPSLTPVLAAQTAYILSAPLPPELLGAPLQVFFDLFDNQDQVGSLGYFRSVSVIPEPPAGLLVAFAAILQLGITRCRRKFQNRRSRQQEALTSLLDG